jgi:hypothetical protein
MADQSAFRSYRRRVHNTDHLWVKGRLCCTSAPFMAPRLIILMAYRKLPSRQTPFTSDLLFRKFLVIRMHVTCVSQQQSRGKGHAPLLNHLTTLDLAWRSVEGLQIWRAGEHTFNRQSESSQQRVVTRKTWVLNLMKTWAHVRSSLLTRGVKNGDFTGPSQWQLVAYCNGQADMLPTDFNPLKTKLV